MHKRGRGRDSDEFGIVVPTLIGALRASARSLRWRQGPEGPCQGGESGAAVPAGGDERWHFPLNSMTGHSKWCRHVVTAMTAMTAVAAVMAMTAVAAVTAMTATRASLGSSDLTTVENAIR